MTLCYFCQESFTTDGYKNICPECRASFRQALDKHKPEKWSIEDLFKALGPGLTDFANDLPKRFVKKRTLK